MNVSDVMTPHPSACDPYDSLEHVAGIMWDRDCGAVPVVDGAGTLQGIVTDRDVAMSAYLKGRPIATISVSEVMSRDLHCCTATDTVESALATMRKQQVHRMPVVDGEGRLTGMLAMADILMSAKRADAKQRSPMNDVIVETLAVVRRPRTAAPLPAPATAGAKDAGAGAVLSSPSRPSTPPLSTHTLQTPAPKSAPSPAKPAASAAATPPPTKPSSGPKKK